MNIAEEEVEENTITLNHLLKEVCRRRCENWCSKCHCSKSAGGCAVCLEWAASGARGFYLDADGRPTTNDAEEESPRMETAMMIGMRGLWKEFREKKNGCSNCRWLGFRTGVATEERV